MRKGHNEEPHDHIFAKHIFLVRSYKVDEMGACRKKGRL
jgi:hypothetical protein